MEEKPSTESKDESKNEPQKEEQQNEIKNNIENEKQNMPQNEPKNESQKQLQNEAENIPENESINKIENESQNIIPQNDSKIEPPKEQQNEPPKEQQNEPPKEQQNEPPKEQQNEPPKEQQNEPQKKPKYIIDINRSGKKFDLLKINSLIKKNTTFKEEDCIFEFYKEYNPKEEEEEANEIIPKYIVDIKSEKFRYLGVLSHILTKEKYGYNLYDNGDEYFGQWNSNKKEGFGIYYFNDKDKNLITHLYIGEFEDNRKYGNGIYFKVKTFEEKENLNRPRDFNFMIGKFSFDNLKKGIIYDLEGDNRKIYNGKINDKGEKNDENAEIYENENKIFNGTIKNNILLNGRMIVLKKGENGTEKEEAYYFERKDDKKDDEEINFDYRKGEEKDDELIQKMKNRFDIYDCEQLKDLYMKALEIREKVLSPENFEFIKNLDFDIMIKEELIKLYEKYYNFE